MQSPMKQMRNSVMTLDRVATRLVHGEFDLGSSRRRVLVREKVQPRVPTFLRVDDPPKLSAVRQFSRVTDLTAGFGIRGRIIDDDCGPDLHTDDFQDLRLRLNLIVSNKA